MLKKLFAVLVVSCLFGQAFAQDSVYAKVSQKYLQSVSSKANKIEHDLTMKTEKVLEQMRKEEQKLKKKLSKIDSLAANRLFSGAEKKYNELQEKLSGSDRIISQAGLNYIPYLDTLKTALQFLKGNVDKLKDQSSEMQDKLKNAVSKVNGLETKLDQAQAIRQFLKERRQYLKEQLSKYGLARQMKKMNKQVYYYSQAIHEYKNILKDPKKIEEKALAVLRDMPAFKKFLQSNSQIASLLGISSGNGSNPVQVSFTGLQSRASVQQLIQNSVAIGGANPQQFLNRQLRDADKQISAQKNAIRFPELPENMGEMPDFKPNQQKSKPFLKRLEYSSNVQFGKVNRFLPITSEMAFSVGYKLNDNGIIGVGSSYKLGLGTGITRIRLSHQGFGLRSYVDWKMKGSIFISGGYEKNYLPQLDNAIVAAAIPGSSQFRSGPWQESGLIGISKKYPISKRRKGYVQVLFDFLSYKNIPRSQPVLFRTGVNF